MDRKVKELIPLFAIGIMVIGAVMLLVAMNSTEETQELKNDQEVNNEGKIKIDNEVSEPVATIKDDETKEDETKVDTGTSFDILNNATTETTTTDVTTVTTETTTTDSSSGMKSYIESMVNGFLPTTSTSTSTSTINVSNNTSSLADNATHFFTSTPTTTTTTVTNKINGTKTEVTTYNNISKSVNVGNYVVSTTTNNKIILANSSNKNVAISTLDAGTVTILTVNNSSIYAFEQGGGLKRYSISGGKLVLSAKGYVPFEANELCFSNEYIYMTSTQGALYAYVERESTFVQAGFTREINSITDITSVSGSKVSVRCGSTNYTYTFDGLSFIR